MGMTTAKGSTTCELPVFFATTEGQTRRIAERLASVLRDRGFESKAIDMAGTDAANVDWTRVRGVMVGASLHRGRHQREADKFVRAHVADLNYLPSAFVSVSLSAASKNRTEVEAAAQLARAFPETRGWKPTCVASVAGRLAYSEYGFFIRLVMRYIARKEGAPTDMSRDYELTNWEEVNKLACDFAARIGARTAVA